MASEHRGEPASGYLLSAVVFAGITGAWAFLVREDPFYRFVDIGAVRLPVTTILYLVIAPLAGYVIGSWRYHLRHEGGSLSFAGKLIARAVHFTYSHSLLVLFTVAMMTDYFLGLNIDETVRSLDDQAFDIAARYAPWLAAYLAGFNVGRAVRSARSRRVVVEGDASDASYAGVVESRSKRSERRRGRSEPVLGSPKDAVKGDLALPEPVAPAAAAADDPAAASAADEPGFLPPQDFSKLRPGLDQLR